MKIEYVRLGDGTRPVATVLDTVTWTDTTAPTYDTGKARPLLEALSAIYGAGHTRDLLSGGWSNGYVSTRAV